jgi:hypothetical protein
MVDSSKWLQLLDADSFSDLFIDELGWNKPVAERLTLSFEGGKFDIQPVANFKGIQVWSCNSLPNARIQREIDKEVSKFSTERLTIFHDDLKQTWRWPMSRESTGKGNVRLVSHDHIKGQKTLSLLQRLEAITIPLKDNEPSLVEMLKRLRKAFDAEHVTKKFYKEFSVYQKRIVSQLSGLERSSDKEWYSSLLLNRIMFIYFMQWKGFMDGNQNYLADRLQKVKEIQGPDKFYGFFKDFMLPLFHEGLGAGTKITVPPEIAMIVGSIPYVNGGIFSEHELERANDINIPDEAFDEVFAFFDNYQWHLDARSTGNPNEINPDVLGYVFEQFINNKDQGAYYTKEDITDYMTSNTLVVRFLQLVDEECQINLFKQLVQNPDRYIWPSLRQGELGIVEIDSQGVHDILPGESEFEVRERKRYVESIRNSLANGDVNSISDLISFNLDLELLATDIIDGLDTSEDVIRIWKILSSIKVVDPTCGSGAFLFAALNQLESLYSTLLDVGELHARTSKNAELKELLSEIGKHPNRKYFILKHAAQKNLYGVDLMKEATEIARLRLFLKLISAIDSYDDIEPLPDLEFNIKSGNLLIGMTSSDRLSDYLTTLDSIAFIEDIKTQVVHLADLWDNFLLSQELGHEKSKNAKKILSNGTQILRSTLDKLFYEAVVVNRNMQTFAEWKESTSPFHWFVEFPDVFQSGGFDVVIGNPPYIKKSKVSYDISGHFTSDSPDIYAICMERASLITNTHGIFAMIVMTNLAFSERFEKLREYLTKRFPQRWLSGYAKRPSLLFDGVQVRNAIFIGTDGDKLLHSAPLRRWVKEYRPHLMSSIRYAKVQNDYDRSASWPFLTSEKIFEAISASSGSLKSYAIPKGPEYELIEGTPKWDKNNGTMSPLFYSGTAYNWISAFKVVPPAIDGNNNPVITSTLSVIWFKDEVTRDIALSLVASKWMFAWWAIYGDDFHVTRENILSFPIDLSKLTEPQRQKLVRLSNTLQAKMLEKIKWQKVTFPDKRVIKVGNYDLSNCQTILSEIDDEWSLILGAEKLKEQLQYQYYSTVKTVSSLTEAPDND